MSDITINAISHAASKHKPRGFVLKTFRGLSRADGRTEIVTLTCEEEPLCAWTARLYDNGYWGMQWVTDTTRASGALMDVADVQCSLRRWKASMRAIRGNIINN